MTSQVPAIIDSHCHLHSINLEEFNQSMDNVIFEAESQGIERFLSVCIELEDVPKLYQLATQYSNVMISVGVHPNIEMQQEPSLEELVRLASHPVCIAIGETGLDYYRLEKETGKKTQQQRFQTHIQAAIQLNKPLIIHTREAAEDTLQFLRDEKAFHVGGVMHCFTESWEVAQRALDLNFYISISGIVTFKNAHQVQEVATKVPLDRLLIETDSPYLAPVPYRGKQNHPALVKYVAKAIAELRQIDYEQLAHQTTENFYQCFKLSNN